MSFWKLLSLFFDRKYFLVTTIFCMSSVLFIHTHFTTQRIESINELETIEGSYSSHSFIHGAKSTRMYYFKLQEYACTFQVAANHLDYFGIGEFVGMVYPGCNVRVLVPKSKLNELQADEKICVYHVSVEGFNVLSTRNTIQKEKDWTSLYIAFGFFLAGILFFVIRWNIWIRYNL